MHIFLLKDCPQEKSVELMCWQDSILATYQQNDCNRISSPRWQLSFNMAMEVLEQSSGCQKYHITRPNYPVHQWKCNFFAPLLSNRSDYIFEVSLLSWDLPETTQVSSHSSNVPKLLAFPPQPPYSNSSQCPLSTLKKNRSLIALQGPFSSFSAHNSLKIRWSRCALFAEVGHKYSECACVHV